MARRDSAARAEAVSGGFASAKKNITIQYQGRERLEENLMAQIRRDAINQGMKDEEIEIVDVYIKPEESAVFYVINKQLNGKIDF